MYPRILRRQLLVQFSVAAISSAVTFVKSVPFGWRRIMPPAAFLDGDAVLLQEPVREIFKARCNIENIRNLFPQNFLYGFKLLLLGRLSGCSEGCVCKIEFLLPTPTRPILGFVHTLLRAVEQVDPVQSGTLAQLHDFDTEVPHGLGRAGVLHALTPVAGLLHIGLALYLSCSDAADHDVDVDVSRMVVPIRVSADDGGMTGEVVLAELQAKGLRPLYGQAVLYCVLRVEADDIMVGLHVRRLFVKQYSTNDTATGCQDWLLFTPLGLKSIKSHDHTAEVLAMGLFVSGSGTPLSRCNTLDFVPKSCAKGDYAPLKFPLS